MTTDKTLREPLSGEEYRVVFDESHGEYPWLIEGPVTTGADYSSEGAASNVAMAMNLAAKHTKSQIAEDLEKRAVELERKGEDARTELAGGIASDYFGRAIALRQFANTLKGGNDA